MSFYKLKLTVVFYLIRFTDTVVSAVILPSSILQNTNSSKPTAVSIQHYVR